MNGVCATDLALCTEEVDVLDRLGILRAVAATPTRIRRISGRLDRQRVQANDSPVHWYGQVESEVSPDPD